MAQEARKVSFKNVGSAAAAAPIVDAATGEVENPNVDVSAALAPREEGAVAPTAPSGSYFGGEDEVDAADIRYPYVNLVQPTSKSPLIEHGVGNFVLAKDTKLGPVFRAVVVGFSRPRFEEKVKWGAPQGKRFATIEEVHAAGGTTNWSESRENRDSRSTKVFYDTQRTALLLVEKPADVSDARFGTVIGDKAYAIALLIVKGTSYPTVYVNLNSEQKNGPLREGFYSRLIQFSAVKTSPTSEALKMRTIVGEKTPEAVVAKALELRA